MPIPVTKIAGNAPYDLFLQFVGIAIYSVDELAPDGAGGWSPSKNIVSNAASTDPQHDAYAMTPLAPADQRLVIVRANMSSAVAGANVSTTTAFKQNGAQVYTDTAPGTDPTQLTLRAIFQGS